MIDKDYRKSYQAIFSEALKKSAPGYYDEAALPSYTHRNRLMSWLFWKRIQTALAMAGKLEGKSVFDFGCGGGVTFKYLQQNDCSVTGCDYSFCELAAEVCKALGARARVVRDLFTISDEKFAVIFALDVLEHVEDPERIVDKLLALSERESQIIISGPTENVFYRAGRALAGFSGHYHLRNIYDIEDLFRRKNLRRTSLRNLYLPIPLFRISSWRK